MGDQESHVALGRSVIIVGTGSLQNKLLANLIEQRTGYACSTRPADQLNGEGVALATHGWIAFGHPHGGAAGAVEFSGS